MGLRGQRSWQGRRGPLRGKRERRVEGEGSRYRKEGTTEGIEERWDFYIWVKRREGVIPDRAGLNRTRQRIST